jgi:hypothetical protein
MIELLGQARKDALADLSRRLREAGHHAPCVPHHIPGSSAILPRSLDELCIRCSGESPCQLQGGQHGELNLGDDTLLAKPAANCSAHRLNMEVSFSLNMEKAAAEVAAES